MSDRKEEKIKILFAEDLPTDLELAKREIRKEGISFEYVLVETEEAFRTELNAFDPDIVISDYSMPTFDGMSALKITRSHENYFPFIILTGSMNEETAVKCMKAGANDYVIKEQIKRLPFAILEAIENNKSRIDKERIENKLVRSEERFRLLFNEVPNIAIIGHSKDGTVNYWNQACSKLFGYEENEALGETVFDLIIPGNLKKDFSGNLQRAYQTERSLPAEELIMMKKSGKLFPVSCNQVVLKLFGEVKDMYSIIINLTERNKMIQDLVEAKNKAEESDRLKSAFLMNMSHEIRTPMNGIIGFTDLLSRPKLTGAQKEQYISIIQSSGQRMLSTVNDIIEISRIESGEVIMNYDTIDPEDLLKEVCGFYKSEAESKGLVLTHSCSKESLMIHTDTAKLHSILSNLIKNSIKFTNEGCIEVCCNKDEEKEECIFSVKDTGIGIPKDRQDAIFNRFEQADIADTQAYQGSGLGLSIAKSYAEMMKGKIWVESEPAKGSTFFLAIPDNNEMNITDTIINSK